VCLVVVWFLGLIIRSDSQADNGQAKEKAAAAAKEKAAKKAAADKAAEEANKADNAAAEPVHIGGATGSNAANIKGIYDPTSELCCGRRVYKRRDADIWIELFEGKWQVKPASGKGKDDCWAFFAASRALEQCGGSTWQVYDGKAWAVQARVKLMPESRAAFELVHRPTRQLFTSSYQHIDVCYGVIKIIISPDFRSICMRIYGRNSIFLSTETQRCTNWPLGSDSNATNETFFSALGGYYVESGYYSRCCHIIDCRSGNNVTQTFLRLLTDPKEFKTEFRIWAISPDERFLFFSNYYEKEYLNSQKTHPAGVIKKTKKLQIARMTGDLIWEFEFPQILAIICLPDNDSFIVHHSSSISKYSLSSQSRIVSVSVREILQGRCFDAGSLKYSPDGEWVSFENVVVNSRTLQVNILPSGKLNMQDSPVFFLPGSVTAIHAMQVFSLVDGRWTLSMSPKPDALPLIHSITDQMDHKQETEIHHQAFNMVTRTSGSDVFFGNLSFAWTKYQPDLKVSVLLQDS
jgi:hypothetical protein